MSRWPLNLSLTALLIGVPVTFALLTTVALGGPGADDPPAATAPQRPGPSATLHAAPARLTDDRTVVLFDGSGWADAFASRDGADSVWAEQGDGSVEVRSGDAVSRETFGDFQLHLEFWLPLMADQQGQARANSGVYVHGRYEVQVLDTWGQEPQMGGCGGLYSIAAPLVNASRPPETWQTYDMIFRAPRFDEDGAMTEPARLTVMHNGIVIHNNLTLPSPTPGGLGDKPVARGPILLQDHGNPVRYRNIWVRRLD